MSRYSQRTNIVPIVVAIAVILTIILVVSVLIRGSGNNNPQSQTIVKDAMLDFNNSSLVSMTVRGPIVGNEDFRKYKVSITPTKRTIYLYSGYQPFESSKNNFANNQLAFEQFVYALTNYGFARQSASFNSDDVRGICPSGKLYSFDIEKDGESIGGYWTSSCSSAKGTLGVSLNSIKNLFLLQIPDYNSMINI